MFLPDRRLGFLLLLVAPLVVLVLLIYMGGTPPAAAQSDTMLWSSLTNLSDTPPYSGHPAIAADDYGYVHVFWSEELGGAPLDHRRSTLGNSIFYTRWDGVSWTEPVDVLFVSGEPIAEYVSVEVDHENRIHVVWTAETNIYYSNAPSWQAASAHAWSRPIVIATESALSRWESDVVVDDRGVVHVVYATRGLGAGVYHTRSEDVGKTWELAIQLSEPLDLLETSFSTVKVIVDDAGRLYAVWQTSQIDGFGQAVYHAWSEVGSQTWSAPAQLRYRGEGDTFVEYPFILSRGGSELHLIYTNGSNVGRAHRLSTDGGETWGEAKGIITEMEGINGYVAPVADDLGQMHLIINMRTKAEQVVGIYYASWLGDDWSAVEPLAVGYASTNQAHYTVVAVNLGREIHVVWNDITHGDIWHTYAVAPSVEPSPRLPTPSPIVPTPLPVSPEPTVPSVDQETASPGLEETMQAENSPDRILSTLVLSNPLVMGTGAALLLVASVMLIWRVRSR